MSDSNKKKENSLVNFIKRYFFTGLLISAPIGATIYITIFIVEFIAGLVPQRFNPNGLLPEIKEKQKTEMVNVFVPTTPNPTSGFLLFIPKDDIVELDMSVEDAIKLVVSAGMVVPPKK